jgi:hypothetical protein
VPTPGFKFLLLKFFKKGKNDPKLIKKGQKMFKKGKNERKSTKKGQKMTQKGEN